MGLLAWPTKGARCLWSSGPCQKNPSTGENGGAECHASIFFLPSRIHSYTHNLRCFQHGENSQNRRKIRLIETGGYIEMSSILADLGPRIWVQMPGGGRFAGSQTMSTAVHRSTYKLWRSNSMFNLRIESNAKCRYLKNLPEKGLCGKYFICLRPPPSYDPILPPPLDTEYVFTVYLVTQGRGRES
jgi:hypothetical protein